MSSAAICLLAIGTHHKCQSQEENSNGNQVKTVGVTVCMYNTKCTDPFASWFD